MNWIYGELTLEQACIVEALRAIAEQLEQLNKNLDKIKNAIDTKK